MSNLYRREEESIEERNPAPKENWYERRKAESREEPCIEEDIQYRREGHQYLREESVSKRISVWKRGSQSYRE
jgi:hypothetical protein